MKYITNAEKKLFLLKLCTVGLGVFFGFIQPAIFIRNLDDNDLKFIFMITGFATYLTFFDFGLSKPAYSRIRKLFIDEENLEDEIKLIMVAVSFIFLVTSLLFTLFISIRYFGNESNLSISYASIVFFCVSLSLTIVLANIKVPLVATDNYVLCQKVELAKSIFYYLSVFFLFVDSTFQSTALMMLASMSSAVIYLVTITRRKFIHHSLIFNNIKESFNRLRVIYFSRSFDYFIFSICESLIYNLPFIILPLLYLNGDIIEFSLWMKLYLASILISKLITETFIHRLTKKIHTRSRDGLKDYVIILVFCLSLSVMISLFFTLFSDEIFDIWTSSKYYLTDIYLIAFWLFSLGNSLQNVSGTLLLSLGENFKFMKKASSVFAGLFIATYIVGYSFDMPFQRIFLLTSIWYLIGALVYFVKCYKVILNATKV
ncbi:hypothetical protein V6932_002700 [Vibrio alginolyticus]